ncbi:hypothetical protein SAMN05443575_3212 [Jatrophihabitans endophyticus]|uniref:ChsH2 C-terminal OB-fold domain-containing protein n=1 Tax=Jatrophihabitans endophyticus TaxID=1206085 RepID=A0A1M5PVT9_9ACTN|nr:OB-fold domain-containing protein [Jatrophihabitans endophyticus]SHH05938.1 hypothetical protein SAMN05443575_3212 [Jatrophihabitans endophyticus]
MNPIRFRTVTPTELGVEYWEQTATGVLPLRECRECGRSRQYLTAVCGNCESVEWRWVAASGRGTVYAASLNHYRMTDEFPDEYVVAMVDLEEGVRVMTNLVGPGAADARIGAPVHVVFESLDDGKKVPVFALD